ncbi:MAG: hypothetical protein IJ526_01580 [Lachnospiraceae bacterium]|nr:hypothetical protein [Lachnospiraceae bacterium]
MATKEELLREIDIVTTFSSKYNMKDSSQASKYISFFEEKKVFKTQIGIKYIERLNLIKDGKTKELCFICKKNPSYDGILCDECMSKYTRGKKSFFGRNNVEDLNNAFAEDTKSEMLATPSSAKDTEQMKNASDVAKVKAEISAKMSSAGEKAKQLAKDNDLEGKTEVAKEIAKDAGNTFIKWWKARKKWQKIAIISIAAVLVLGIIIGNTGGGFKNDADSFISTVENEFIDYMKELGAKSDIPVEIKLYSGSEQGSEGKYIYNLYFDEQNNATIGVNYKDGKRNSILVSSGMGVDSFLTTVTAVIKAADSSLSTSEVLKLEYQMQETFNNYMSSNSDEMDVKKGKLTYVFYVDPETSTYNLLIEY